MPSAIGELAASAGSSGRTSRIAACSRANSSSSGERQVDVHALQVRPAVAAAVEDAVVRPVDRRRVLRPQHASPSTRIHPRMHRRWASDARSRAEQTVRRAVISSWKRARQARRARRGRDVLDLDRRGARARSTSRASPRRRSLRRAPAIRAQQLIGDRAEPRASRGRRSCTRARCRSRRTQGCVAVARSCAPPACARWMRRRKTPMISRYSASFSTPSSLPASTFGLSLTSIT